MRCVLEYESFDKEGIAAVSTDKERYDSVGSRFWHRWSRLAQKGT